jgi:hypothetical protein
MKSIFSSLGLSAFSVFEALPNRYPRDKFFIKSVSIEAPSMKGEREAPVEIYEISGLRLNLEEYADTGKISKSNKKYLFIK